MAYYMEYSTGMLHQVYMKYVAAPRHIIVYSIDEVFTD